MNLSDEAYDVLLNAEARTGGRPGVTDPGREVDVYGELQQIGLLSPRWYLTRQGAELAKQFQRELAKQFQRDRWGI